MKNNKVAHVS